MPDILLSRGRVYLNGQFMDNVAPGKVDKARVLFAVLRKMAALRQNKNLPPYTLTLGDDIDGAQWKGVVRTAAVAGWNAGRLRVGDSLISFQPTIAGSGNDPAMAWPGEVPLFVLRSENVEIFHFSAERALAAANAQASSIENPSQSVATLAPDELETKLPALLERECALDKQYRSTILVIENNGTAQTAIQILQTLVVTTRKQRSSPFIDFRMDEALPKALFPKPPPEKQTPDGMAHGKLPAELIQKEVRARFGGFRKCYESGLALNKDLAGRVAIRFVIGIDGKVIESSPDVWMTDLADERVVACVVEHFKSLAFPAPEKGRVIVIYPIQFSPDK